MFGLTSRGKIFSLSRNEQRIPDRSGNPPPVRGTVIFMTLDQIIENTTTTLKNEDIVEGVVIAIQKAALYVDLGTAGTGIIYGAEFMNARDVIKRINMGDTISAKIILRENKDGYVDLSLKEARQALIWSDAEVAIREKRIMDLVVKEANKGGLIIEWQGIQGFLPASQLKDEHYPRVEDGDKDKILRELKKLIGKRIPAGTGMRKYQKLFVTMDNISDVPEDTALSEDYRSMTETVYGNDIDETGFGIEKM